MMTGTREATAALGRRSAFLSLAPMTDLSLDDAHTRTHTHTSLLVVIISPVSAHLMDTIL